VMHMHKARLTRNQIVMFTLADMMTVCEVAGAFAHKAGRLREQGDPQGEIFTAMSRVFARKAVRMVSAGADLCAGGWTAEQDQETLTTAETMLKGVRVRFPMAMTAGLWPDMVSVGEHLKSKA